MIKRVLLLILFLFSALFIYSLLPKPWTNELEARLLWRAFLKNEQGLKAFSGKDLSQATSAWAEGLSSSPGLMPLHFNLAVGWQLMNRSDEAIKAYNILFKNPESGSVLQYNGHFNIGTMYQASKDTDKALESYQAALDILPSSKETKINIELLIQQQQGGGGKGENQNKDQGKGEQDKKDDDSKGDKDKEKDQPQDQKKEYAKQPKPQKKDFKSEQLSQSDVNKILGEIKQQEQKIRSEYNKKESKEQPRDKDW